MGALCLLPSTPPSCPCGAAGSPRLVTRRNLASCYGADSGGRPQLACKRRRRRRGRVVRAGGDKGEGGGGGGGGAEFFGEDGVVEDMDGYLNYLSLEYDSVWDTKPSWCQPWTILLSGAVAIAGSWLPIHSVVITTGVSFVICAWWYIFLYSYPKAYNEMIAERRRKVASGAEDTYGMEKIQ
ncbi:uncharacterized protein LOC102700606 isoform X2 [Oryza brachyantha]|nr:uncharacterized protein LOC102700606 isoform X2 [Oryza brachyantha]